MNRHPPAARDVYRGIRNTVIATAAFGLVHSLTADHALKDAAERAWGERRRNAFYRPLYNVTSIASLAALTLYVRRQPSRMLYHVRGPAAWAMRAGQAAGVATLAGAAWRTGPLKFAGLPGLAQWLLRRPKVDRPPAGQGPALRPDNSIEATGPFARMRQPANVAMVPLVCLNPRMTSRFAAFCATTAVYAVLGSLHSDRVLRREYGRPYREYQRRVPMLRPKIPDFFADRPRARR